MARIAATKPRSHDLGPMRAMAWGLEIVPNRGCNNGLITTGYGTEGTGEHHAVEA